MARLFRAGRSADPRRRGCVAGGRASSRSPLTIRPAEPSPSPARSLAALPRAHVGDEPLAAPPRASAAERPGPSMALRAGVSVPPGGPRFVRRSREATGTFPRLVSSEGGAPVRGAAGRGPAGEGSAGPGGGRVPRARGRPAAAGGAGAFGGPAGGATGSGASLLSSAPPRPRWRMIHQVGGRRCRRGEVVPGAHRRAGSAAARGPGAVAG